jgi:ketopantoate reductase
MEGAHPVVIVGMGELGGELSRGLLRAGRTVVPVLRGASLESFAGVPKPELVLVTVGEPDLDPVLGTLSPIWKTRIGLVQNEVLPRTWRAHGIRLPTVAVVWFEKKPGRVAHALLPTVLAGPSAPLLATALAAIGQSARVVSSDELELELVAKNLYILLVNLAGMRTRGTVASLWNDHRALAESVGNEVLDLQEALTEKRLPRAELFERFERAVAADPDHVATGRSAPSRLERALAIADAFDLPVPTLRSIAKEDAS